MEFKENIEKYLSGKKFSKSFKVDFNINLSKSLFYDRILYLTNISQKKKVIHVGCVDHMPLIKSKIKDDTWLHKKLSEASTKCVGIDINKDGINFLKKELKYTNVHYMDILNSEIPIQIIQEKWDVMILGEILEHIDNPVQFLTKLREKFYKYVEYLVITVPNAFRFNNFLSSLKHFEHINSDHRYWFTPYTLSKICTLSNYKVDSFDMIENFKTPTSKFVKRYFIKRYPLLRDTIILKLKFNEYE
ncbi:MAG: methyltransferase domain-containing protein [Candidatus Delongbacteria bacterium]|jgi:hypothetical protein|nr:methyltransferase domain-containing protein [Candidatus Delongbacteria bacterium]